MPRKYEVFACREDGCGYFRAEKSTGVHMANELRNGLPVLVSHELEPVTAYDARDVEPLTYAVRALLKERVDAGVTQRLPDNEVTRELLENLACALKAFEDEEGQ